MLIVLSLTKSTQSSDTMELDFGYRRLKVRLKYVLRPKENVEGSSKLTLISIPITLDLSNAQLLEAKSAKSEEKFESNEKDVKMVYDKVEDLEDAQKSNATHISDSQMVEMDLVEEICKNPIFVESGLVKELGKPVVDQIIWDKEYYDEELNKVSEYNLFSEESYDDLYLNEGEEEIMVESQVNGSWPEEVQVMYLEFLRQFN
ncbi:hypothetical protein L6452_38987 [Arctium lappa]|uniref:Uncharacterized protein n=1 Tax=Arctium lappa TaxID=4217 RepID=A0ACB8XSS6_ARCLA|nr:hypothetical protein L6452_38987 [Arctium lappa]